MPLSRFRILQVGSGVALDYCGKLFADFGADVIKLEPAGGDPLRTEPPLLENGESGYFAWLNTNKRSVTETPETLAALLPGADVLLDGRGFQASVPPHVSVTRLSWFGEHGPYAAFAGTDAVVRALGGLVALTGRAEGPPTLATDHQSSIIAGVAAFIASAAGLFDRSNGTRRFSVSTHETAVNIAEYEAAVAWDAGESRRRPGVNRFGRNYPVGIYPTKRGLVGVTIVTPGQWRGLCAMMGMPDLARNPRYAINVDRLAHALEIDALFQPVWDTRTAEEWFSLALEYKLPIVMVPTMAELLELPVHRERGAFGPVRIGGAAFEAPVLPQHLTRTPPKSGGTAPLAGEDEAQWHVSPNAWPDRPAPPDRRPLEGVRIVDLTMGWAGPTAARHLGDLGAEVLKVEACQYPDWWRGTDLRAEFIAAQKYEKILWFQLMNRNKLDVTLDLTHPDGAALLKRLVAEADIVIENYSSEVLPKLGLDYSVLSRVNPNLIMLSMPAFGSNNAWSACRGYGSTLEQASGLPTVTGFPEDPPTMNQTAYGDPVGGFNAAAALMAALLHRQATGQGQNIDLSQVECMIPFVAPELIAQSALGETPPRLGNRHPVHVPHGCFPCAGDDRWVTIAVTGDAAWRACCALLHRPDLADLTASDRRASQAELEAVLAGWTATLDAEEAMTRLQRAGIAAGVVRRPMELDQDAHLTARGFWHRHDRPFTGPHWHSSAPFREGRDAYKVRRVAPTLGQDNEAILGGRLGLSTAEIQRLADSGVIGTIPRPRRAQSDA
ncbi:CaiB/BaiF CoA-transferase family protein [Rhodopila sp.]|uniref:CaiB/BaiF CoA-transferase family protein n=1 Tax=Rhodopila sp. TaxID=2480087 RepID=UPI002C2C476B|nr:CoA transferase [Rhodopila sp.]HVZ10114.1 CoA transferase [Rhodopila sp.]